MRKPTPHGPYSAEELSNMNDDELGRLYREKNESVGILDFGDLLGSFVVGAMGGFIPSIITGMMTNSAFMFFSVLAFCAMALSIWYLVDISIDRRRHHNRGEDAFDDLYPHEEDCPVFLGAFTYLCMNTSIRNGDEDFYNWISVLKEVSSDDGSDYTDAELGQLLKIIIPVLAYMKESGHDMKNTDFEVLDKEFNLTKQLNGFMDTTYAEMLDRKDRERERKDREYETRLKAELDNEHKEAKQIAAKIKDKNKRYAEGLAELEKSADYRKMMDLKRTLDEKKKMLSEQVKTEKQKIE